MAHTLHNGLRLLVLCLPLAGCVTLDSGALLGGARPVPQVAVAPLDATGCDRAAASPNNPDNAAGVAPVDWNQLDASAAIAACQQALAAHPDHPRLLSQLARAYQKGEQRQQAYETMAAAARQDYPYALYTMGWYHETGVGTPVQFDTALSWYAKAGQRGMPAAWNRMGIVYTDKRKPRDANRAIDAFRKAGEAGDLNGMTNASALLRSLNRRGDQEEALAWARRAAERGSATGARMVGRHYWDQKDFRAARPWFQRAAEAGDTSAWHELGHFHLVGSAGVRQDTARAISYYERAALGGYQHSAMQLARLYALGREVPADPVQARRWLMHGMPKLSVSRQANSRP